MVLGGTCPKCPSYYSKTLYLVLHPPTPSTLSPLEKGGEGRGEGGSHIHVLCPFGTLLVTLDHFLAQTFFLGGTSPQRPRPVERWWAGIMGFCEPPLPKITWETDRVVSVFACNGMGAALSSVIADQAAEALLQRWG